MLHAECRVASNASCFRAPWGPRRSSVVLCADHTSAEAAELRKLCQLNLASCYLRTGQNQDVVTLCSEVLDIDPANWKALYRRGQAHAAVGDGNRAVLDLEAARAASPTSESAAVEEKLEAARSLRAQQLQVHVA